MPVLAKYGHVLVHANDPDSPLELGVAILVPCLKQYGTLMNDGYPPHKDEYGDKLGTITLDFEGWAVPMYPEVANCQWVRFTERLARQWGHTSVG